MPPVATHFLYVVEFRSAGQLVRFTTNAENSDDALCLFRAVVQPNYVDVSSLRLVPLAAGINASLAHQGTTGYYTSLQNEDFRMDKIGNFVALDLVAHRIHKLKLLIAD